MLTMRRGSIVVEVKWKDGVKASKVMWQLSLNLVLSCMTAQKQLREPSLSDLGEVWSENVVILCTVNAWRLVQKRKSRARYRVIALLFSFCPRSLCFCRFVQIVLLLSQSY